MWYKVEIKLKDDTIIKDHMQFDSVEDLKQSILNTYPNQIAYIKASGSLPPEQ